MKLAISIRQPWAWLIVNGHKSIENRSWETRFRGPIYIHAGKGMTNEEYSDCQEFANDINPLLELPAFHMLNRGGIVGEGFLSDCVTESNSPWFVGEYGFVIRNAKSLPFTPCAGMLGLFHPQLPSDVRMRTETE